MKRLLPFLTELEAWVEELTELNQMTLDSRQVQRRSVCGVKRPSSGW